MRRWLMNFRPSSTRNRLSAMKFNPSSRSLREVWLKMLFTVAQVKRFLLRKSVNSRNKRKKRIMMLPNIDLQTSLSVTNLRTKRRSLRRRSN